MPNHLNRDWLFQKYAVDGLSTYDIARMVGRNPKRVYEKLVAFGIPTRPRGLNLKGTDNFMQQPGATNPFAGKRHTEETKAVLRRKASVAKPYLRGKSNGMFGRNGALNPRFIDGSSPERQRMYASARWKSLVRRVYKRDGYKCQRCGDTHASGNVLHAHHKKSWAGHPRDRFRLDNLVTLCDKCHCWVHSKKNLDRDLIEP